MAMICGSKVGGGGFEIGMGSEIEGVLALLRSWFTSASRLSI